MKVNDRMEQHALSVVADAAGSKGYFISIVIDYGEELLGEGHRLVNL
jgi:Fe-S cluster assembly iron-binding protein IscA